MNWKSGFQWLPAFLVLLLGLRFFVQRYPDSAKSPKISENSVLNESRISTKWIDSDKGEDSVNTEDTLAVRNIFRQPARLSGSKPLNAIPKIALSRKWVLRGTTGNKVATLVDSVGMKHLVRVGESVDGTRLLEVQADYVLMKDAAGPFELKLLPKP